MIERRFHRDLYRRDAVDEAVRRFDGFSTLTREDDDTHYVVRIDSSSAARTRRVADELSNFALGLTIQQREA